MEAELPVRLNTAFYIVLYFPEFSPWTSHFFSNAPLYECNCKCVTAWSLEAWSWRGTTSLCHWCVPFTISTLPMFCFAKRTTETSRFWAFVLKSIVFKMKLKISTKIRQSVSYYSFFSVSPKISILKHRHFCSVK